jgi:hypothetical protein
MERKTHTIDIDGLVFDGLDLSPERAERLGELLRRELEQLLSSPWSWQGVTSSFDIETLEARGIGLDQKGPWADGRGRRNLHGPSNTGSFDERQLAHGVARSIADALSHARPQYLQETKARRGRPSEAKVRETGQHDAS